METTEALAARETLMPPSGGLTDSIRNVGTLAAVFSGHGMSAATAGAAAMALYSKDGVGILTSGLAGIVPYATLRLIGQQPPAKAMSILADLAARNPQIGQALSTTLSRYGADYASRRQSQGEH